MPTAKKSTTSTTKSGFTAEERAAMRARAEELRSSGRKGAKKADEADACLEAIAKMPDDDRALAERVHSIIRSAAPDLAPKTWYGMPAYANEENKVVCFFKPASKFGVRYCTLGFNDAAQLDDGAMWPTEYAVTSMSDTVAKRIETLIERATS